MPKSTLFRIVTFFILGFALPQFLAAQASLNRANKQYELFDFKDAIKLYSKVLSEDTNNVEALSKIADCYLQINQLSEAKMWFEKAIQQRGFEYKYMQHYAQTLMGLGEYDKARQWFLLYGEGFPQVGEHFAKACEIAKVRTNAPSAYDIELTPISSAHSDFAPAFFGEVVVFASQNDRRVDENAIQAQQNILFLSTKNKDLQLQKASYLFPTKLTNQYGIGPLSYSADGKRVAFTKNNFRDGIRQTSEAGVELSLYLADVQENGQWKNIVPFPYNGSGCSTGYPSLSADGNTLYFSSSRPDGLGGFDIYVSTLQNGEWTFPINLGAPLNSPGDEITPFFEGKDLYFSSNWHHGFGGFDVFRAEKEGMVWAKIFHQGTGINTARDDYGFIFDKQAGVGYLSSNRTGGAGMEDIYKVAVESEKFLVQIYDESTNQPIEAVKVDFSSCGQKVAYTNTDGQYGFQITGSFDCKAVVSKEGYANQIISIRSNGLEEVTVVQVQLKSTSNKETFVGRIIQAGSSQIVEDVWITATNVQTGEATKIQSDVNGYYTLLLELNRSYQVKFSKAGFTEVTRTVNTGNGIDKSILDVTSLIASSTSLPVPSEITSPPIVTTPVVTTPVITIPTPPAPSNPQPPVVKNPEPTPEPKTTPVPPSTPSLQEGYSVQIAALPATGNFSEAAYNKASQVGKVYTKTDQRFHRVRVGVFATKSAASTAQKMLYNIGYTDAYVVNETGVQLKSTIESTPAVPPTSTTNVTNYYVRLGAYRNPSSFDHKGLDVYGDFVQYPKGDFTIILLETGSKIGRARVVREKAKEKGFSGAYIVTQKNGVYVRV